MEGSEQAIIPMNPRERGLTQSSEMDVFSPEGSSLQPSFLSNPTTDRDDALLNETGGSAGGSVALDAEGLLQEIASRPSSRPATRPATRNPHSPGAPPPRAAAGAAPAAPPPLLAGFMGPAAAAAAGAPPPRAATAPPAAAARGAGDPAAWAPAAQPWAKEFPDFANRIERDGRAASAAAAARARGAAAADLQERARHAAELSRVRDATQRKLAAYAARARADPSKGISKSHDLQLSDEESGEEEGDEEDGEEDEESEESEYVSGTDSGEEEEEEEEEEDEGEEDCARCGEAAAAPAAPPSEDASEGRLVEMSFQTPRFSESMPNTPARTPEGSTEMVLALDAEGLERQASIWSRPGSPGDEKKERASDAGTVASFLPPGLGSPSLDSLGAGGAGSTAAGPALRRASSAERRRRGHPLLQADAALDLRSRAERAKYHVRRQEAAQARLALAARRAAAAAPARAAARAALAAAAAAALGEWDVARYPRPAQRGAARDLLKMGQKACYRQEQMGKLMELGQREKQKRIDKDQKTLAAQAEATSFLQQKGEWALAEGPRLALQRRLASARAALAERARRALELRRRREEAAVGLRAAAMSHYQREARRLLLERAEKAKHMTMKRAEAYKALTHTGGRAIEQAILDEKDAPTRDALAYLRGRAAAALARHNRRLDAQAFLRGVGQTKRKQLEEHEKRKEEVARFLAAKAEKGRRHLQVQEEAAAPSLLEIGRRAKIQVARAEAHRALLRGAAAAVLRGRAAAARALAARREEARAALAAAGRRGRAAAGEQAELARWRREKAFDYLLMWADRAKSHYSKEDAWDAAALWLRERGARATHSVARREEAAAWLLDLGWRAGGAVLRHRAARAHHRRAHREHAKQAWAPQARRNRNKAEKMRIHIIGDGKAQSVVFPRAKGPPKALHRRPQLPHPSEIIAYERFTGVDYIHESRQEVLRALDRRAKGLAVAPGPGFPRSPSRRGGGGHRGSAAAAARQRGGEEGAGAPPLHPYGQPLYMVEALASAGGWAEQASGSPSLRRPGSPASFPAGPQVDSAPATPFQSLLAAQRARQPTGSLTSLGGAAASSSSPFGSRQGRRRRAKPARQQPGAAGPAAAASRSPSASRSVSPSGRRRPARQVAWGSPGPAGAGAGPPPLRAVSPGGGGGLRSRRPGSPPLLSERQAFLKSYSESKYASSIYSAISRSESYINSRMTQSHSHNNANNDSEVKDDRVFSSTEEELLQSSNSRMAKTEGARPVLAFSNAHLKQQRLRAKRQGRLRPLRTQLGRDVVETRAVGDQMQF